VCNRPGSSGQRGRADGAVSVGHQGVAVGRSIDLTPRFLVRPQWNGLAKFAGSVFELGRVCPVRRGASGRNGAGSCPAQCLVGRPRGPKGGRNLQRGLSAGHSGCKPPSRRPPRVACTVERMARLTMAMARSWTGPVRASSTLEPDESRKGVRRGLSRSSLRRCPAD